MEEMYRSFDGSFKRRIPRLVYSGDHPEEDPNAMHESRWGGEDDPETQAFPSAEMAQWKSGVPLSDIKHVRNDGNGHKPTQMTLEDWGNKFGDSNPVAAKIRKFYSDPNRDINPRFHQTEYKCGKCGYSSNKFFESCPNCGQESVSPDRWYKSMK